MIKKDAMSIAEEALISVEERKRVKRENSARKNPAADKEGINPDDLVMPYSTCSVISITDRVLLWDNIKNLDPDVRRTKGTYFIKYHPKSSCRYKKGRPFQIGQDMVRWNLMISGYSEWKALCKVIPELAWIDRHTHMDPFLFNIARMHPGIWFSFSVDWPAYVKMLFDKARDMGVRLEEQSKPLLAFRPSQAEYLKRYKGKAVQPEKTKEDYQAEIDAVEHDPEIKAEMYAETGQTIDDVLSMEENLRLHRNTLRDPVTGRLISPKAVQNKNQE